MVDDIPRCQDVNCDLRIGVPPAIVIAGSILRIVSNAQVMSVFLVERLHGSPTAVISYSREQYEYVSIKDRNVFDNLSVHLTSSGVGIPFFVS